MCCFSIRVLWTVCQNMFVRLGSDLVNFYCYRCCCCCKANNSSVSEKESSGLNDSYDKNFADYIMIADLDEINIPPLGLRPISALPPLPPKIKPFESEVYFRSVDRFSAEEILCNRIDGSCLARPYRESDETIKYIVTVYAKHSYFHLYIRYENEKQKYGIGLKKPFEKLFNTPNDIIDYYRINKLFCTNRTLSACVFLVPIS